MENIKYQVTVRVNGWVDKVYSKNIYENLETAHLAMVQLHGVNPETNFKINNRVPYVSLCKVENGCVYTTIGFYQ